MIYLKTNRLVIRDVRREDFDGRHRLMADPKTMYFLNGLRVRSPEESRANLDDAMAEAENPNRVRYFFTVELIHTGEFVGSVDYTVEEVTPFGKIVGAGYFLLPEYHGRGYATEAFSEVIRFAFEQDNVFRIGAGCFSENRASERVMQKCGMIKEAEYKACALHDGKMKDRVAYRLLKEEWARRGEVSYRLATRWDAAALKELNDLFNGEGSNTAEAIAGAITDNPNEVVCVAEMGDKLIGFCCGQVLRSMCYPSAYGEITELFVAEAERRRGVGRKLISFMESEFRKREIQDFQLFTGQDNSAAQNLYRSCGYRETSERMFRKRP